MKTVLCYGDSLTWGYDATGSGRHALEDRWPSVLQKALGSDAHVIAEGLNGRTTAYDDHLADCDRNGARVLPTVLHTHAPLDLIVFMLGSNDMKPIIHGTAFGAVKGIERLVNLVRRHDWPTETEEGPGFSSSRRRRSARRPTALLPPCSRAGSSNPQCWRRFIAISPTSSTAASSTADRWPGRRRSTVSTSTRRTPGQSAED